MLHISIKAEVLGHFYGLPITNSLLTTWLVMLVLILSGLLLTRNLQLVPGKIQSVLEIIIGGLYNLFSEINVENTTKFFPLLATLFLFIISANWVGLLPGVGSIGIRESAEFVPLFRAATADLNTTIALALISVVAIQYYGFATLGATYVARYVNFKNPIYFFVGILEIVSEVSKIISFAFRLFGNIFAGEVLLAVIAFLMPVFAPIPFLGLEIFVGFIQALVFSLLTSVFLRGATIESSH